MFSKDTADLVLVDIDPECLGDLLSDSAAAKAWISLLQCNDRLDEFT